MICLGHGRRDLWYAVEGGTRHARGSVAPYRRRVLLVFDRRYAWWASFLPDFARDSLTWAAETVSIGASKSHWVVHRANVGVGIGAWKESEYEDRDKDLHDDDVTRSRSDAIQY